MFCGKGEDKVILADKIIHHRKSLALTQEELAAQLGVSRQAVSKWESAQSLPDMERIIQLAGFFGVTIDYLLKDEMESPEYSTADSECSLRLLSLEEANDFLRQTERASKITALGVALGIISPVFLIFLGGLSEKGLISLPEAKAEALGLIVLLSFISVTVGLLMKATALTKPYEFLNEEVFEVQYGVKGVVTEEKRRFRPIHTNYTITGVMLIILAALPFFIGELLLPGSLVEVIAAPLLLLIVAAGVFCLVWANMRNGGYNKILQEEEYTAVKKHHSKIYWSIAGVYWLAITTLFFGWGFGYDAWSRAWIVWPVAGVAFAILMIVLSMFLRDKP